VPRLTLSGDVASRRGCLTRLGLALILAGAAQPVSATATLLCTANDTAVQVTIQASVGLAGSLGAVQGELVLKSEGAAQKLSFTGENVMQHWATGRDVRLRLYRDETLGSADLTIETRGKADDEAPRPGRYRLQAVQTLPNAPSRSVKLNGYATCSVGY
jgi:hypothetical protein